MTDLVLRKLGGGKCPISGLRIGLQSRGESLLILVSSDWVKVNK